jgi:hypothetical protein
MVPLTPTKFVMANQTAREDAREPNFSTASRKGFGFFLQCGCDCFSNSFNNLTSAHQNNLKTLKTY